MRRSLEVFLVLLLFAGLLTVTGFVLTRSRRLSLFLSARDRIERGVPEREVLEKLSRAVDWPAVGGSGARMIARQALESRPTLPGLSVHEYDGWALITWSPQGACLARETPGGWRALR